MSAQGFHEKPTGDVVLWRIGDRTFRHRIEQVYGFDASTGFWRVSIVRHAVPQGLWGETETVQIVRVGSEWLLAPTEHQRPAAAPSSPEARAAAMTETRTFSPRVDGAVTPLSVQVDRA